MLLSEDEMNTRLESEHNLVNIIVQGGRPGRTAGANEIPPMVRGLIGSLSNTSDETNTKIAEVFDVSDGVVSKASRGLVGNRLDKALAAEVSSAKSDIKDKEDKVHAKALDALMSSLEVLAPKIVSESSGLDVMKTAKLARDVSSIVSNIKGKKNDEDTGPRQMVQIVVAPQMKESDYEYITG